MLDQGPDAPFPILLPGNALGKAADCPNIWAFSTHMKTRMEFQASSLTLAQALPLLPFGKLAGYWMGSGKAMTPTGIWDTST